LRFVGKLKTRRTKGIKINDPEEQTDELQKASDLIKKGELVAFPTETVYGLGADAMNEKAVTKIFRAKNRPADNPLIVHISDTKQLQLVARKIPRIAKVLMKKFWPGPLSIVLPIRWWCAFLVIR
jgi:L-threonylcarbamoyladenylate synthase